MARLLGTLPGEHNVLRQIFVASLGTKTTKTHYVKYSQSSERGNSTALCLLQREAKKARCETSSQGAIGQGVEKAGLIKKKVEVKTSNISNSNLGISMEEEWDGKVGSISGRRDCSASSTRCSIIL